MQMNLMDGYARKFEVGKKKARVFEFVWVDLKNESLK
jgi:hypothetical protein